MLFDLSLALNAISPLCVLKGAAFDKAHIEMIESHVLIDIKRILFRLWFVYYWGMLVGGVSRNQNVAGFCAIRDRFAAAIEYLFMRRVDFVHLIFIS